MDKKRLLMILLMGIGIVGMTRAVEVINIDFNTYNDDSVYTGTAAYDDGVNLWRTYYGGWGVALGSPKTIGLVSSGAGAQAGTYAEQVWIGDPGNHDYAGGTALLDDGFVRIPYNPADPNTYSDPNVTFFGQGAYGGIFDMYVYSDQAGDFTVRENDGKQITTKSVSGIFNPGEFVEGGNYVMFDNVSIGEPNQIQLIYTNKLSAVQLVSNKQPVAVSSGLVLDARNYDVAFDTNAREGEFNVYGPDIAGNVSFLDAGEYMDYDITVSAANKGRYSIAAHVVTQYSAASMRILLDGRDMGILTRAQTNTNEVVLTGTSISLNLLEGNHVFRWYTPTQRYNDIVDFVFTRTGNIVMANCADVVLHSANYAGDLTGDCQVDLEDLALLIADWANCYDPAPGACD